MMMVVLEFFPEYGMGRGHRPRWVIFIYSHLHIRRHFDDTSSIDSGQRDEGSGHDRPGYSRGSLPDLRNRLRYLC